MGKIKLEFQKEILLLNKNIVYTHKKSKTSSSIKLAVYKNGDFIVTSPFFVSESSVYNFIIAKASWILKKIEYFKNKPQKERIIHTAGEIIAYKKQAEYILSKRLLHFNAHYNFSYNRVTIKNVTTRWGSCSSKSNLNFNYKMALLPEELVDYIVVHELCHLREMNHSKKFWQLVEEKIPNHKELRKQLKFYQ